MGWGGRCVVVAGLPFANRGDPRLVEKTTFIPATFQRQKRRAVETRHCVEALSLLLSHTHSLALYQAHLCLSIFQINTHTHKHTHTHTHTEPPECGRCVVVAGLPFANRGDPRLVEKTTLIPATFQTLRMSRGLT